MQQAIIYSVSDFVATTNQVLDTAFNITYVEGEVSEYRVSRGKWVYFKLKDEHSSINIFASIYQLNFPIEDGMNIVVKGTPKLHNKYGFSLNALSFQVKGEGSIKKALEMLKKKLAAEGLFSPERKRPIPEFASKIGVISSAQAAGYKDFVTILKQRWPDHHILLADVHVQGERAADEIVQAIEHFNQSVSSLDVLVITRGGGSAEDMLPFSDERVVRAVAGSKFPTVVAVGHEQDTSLCDLAADLRAATPSDAARLIVSDRSEILASLKSYGSQLSGGLGESMTQAKSRVEMQLNHLSYHLAQQSEALTGKRQLILGRLDDIAKDLSSDLAAKRQLLSSLDPSRVLEVGYSIVRAKGKSLSSIKQISKGDKINIMMSDGTADAEVTDVKK